MTLERLIEKQGSLIAERNKLLEQLLWGHLPLDSEERKAIVRQFEKTEAQARILLAAGERLGQTSH